MSFVGTVGAAFINSFLCEKLIMTNETTVKINSNIKNTDKEELFEAIVES